MARTRTRNGRYYRAERWWYRIAYNWEEEGLGWARGGVRWDKLEVNSRDQTRWDVLGGLDRVANQREQ